VFSVTHGHEKASLLLQGTQAAQEAGYHGYAAGHQQQVGGGEGGEGEREGGELRLGEGQPHPHTEQATPPKLHARGEGGVV